MEQALVMSANILAPVETSTLNARPKLVPSTGKRKRKDEEESNSVFEATAYPATSPQRSVTFRPLRLLTRWVLPLSWLDTSICDGPVPPGFIFTASISQFRQSSKPSKPYVLVVRLCPNGGLYAVEKMEDNVYIACALSHWVNEERVKQTATGHLLGDDLQQILEAQNRPRRGQDDRNSKDETLRLPGIDSPKRPKNRRGVMARKTILPTTDLPTPKVEDTAASIQPTRPEEFQNGSQESSRVKTDVTSQPPTPDTGTTPGKPEVSINAVIPFSSDLLRRQYFETLYLSKTSLAYFAKGPLARARALVHSPDSAGVLEQLAEFYRESILPSKRMDLKYKESITNKIDTLYNGDPGERETENPPSQKRKAAKKAKLGKDGLYSDEDEYLRQWWHAREVSSAADMSLQTNDFETKSLIADLRTRETEMQLLLILEVLALEAVQPTHTDASPKDDAALKIEPIDESVYTVLARTPRKVKSKRDLTADLDSLIDKCCIWHTVGIDELLASPEKVGPNNKGSSRVKDKLRDFCADVIIPFYAPRLPDRCKMICRRLGGPEVFPARPKTALTKVSNTPSLPPGTTIKSRPRGVPKRTLERVLSEDQGMRHASPPTLSRSSTTTSLPSLGRETSEPVQRPGSRGGMHKSVSFTNREVDLVADSRVHDAKRRKLARLAVQKQELEAAIDALKRPNRTKAANSIMDDLERRSSERKPGNNRSDQHVQITATPKRPTSKDQWRGEHTFLSIPTIKLPTEDPVIPSSTIRPRLSAEAPMSNRTSAVKRAVLSAIQETPSRGLFASLQDLNAGPDIFNVQKRLDFIQVTPVGSRLRPDMPADLIEVTPLRMIKSQKPVLLTPMKRVDISIEDAFRDAPIIPEQAGKAMDRVMGGVGGIEASIYDSLGWNDDFE